MLKSQVFYSSHLALLLQRFGCRAFTFHRFLFLIYLVNSQTVEHETNITQHCSLVCMSSGNEQCVGCSGMRACTCVQSGTMPVACVCVYTVTPAANIGHMPSVMTERKSPSASICDRATIECRVSRMTLKQIYSRYQTRISRERGVCCASCVPACTQTEHGTDVYQVYVAHGSTIIVSHRLLHACIRLHCTILFYFFHNRFYSYSSV